MRSVKLKKSELLKIVIDNKAKHIKEFNEAVKDYKKAVVKLTKENLDLAKTGDLESIAKIKSMPQSPTSYENSYSRATRMLELSVDDVIELDKTIFNQLVLDEWDWKRMFTATTALYKTI